jgi:hypothetical protein
MKSCSYAFHATSDAKMPWTMRKFLNDDARCIASAENASSSISRNQVESVLWRAGYSWACAADLMKIRRKLLCTSDSGSFLPVSAGIAVDPPKTRRTWENPPKNPPNMDRIHRNFGGFRFALKSSVLLLDQALSGVISMKSGTMVFV